MIEVQAQDLYKGLTAVFPIVKGYNPRDILQYVVVAVDKDGEVGCRSADGFRLAVHGKVAEVEHEFFIHRSQVAEVKKAIAKNKGKVEILWEDRVDFALMKKICQTTLKTGKGYGSFVFHKPRYHYPPFGMLYPKQQTKGALINTKELKEAVRAYPKDIIGKKGVSLLHLDCSGGVLALCRTDVHGASIALNILKAKAEFGTPFRATFNRKFFADMANAVKAPQINICGTSWDASWEFRSTGLYQLVMPMESDFARGF